jgi:tetratricopeptide (TPR) repeat protein
LNFYDSNQAKVLLIGNKLQIFPAAIKIHYQMSQIAKSNFIFLKLLIVLALALFAGACQSDEKSLQNDKQSLETISRISKTFSVGQKPSSEDFESLRQVFEKYPRSQTVNQVYKFALIKREDWASLKNLLSATPFDELSKEDQKNLGNAAYKLGDYAESVAVLGKLADGNDREVISVLANSYFYLGNYSESKLLLDRNWERTKNEKLVNDITLRGLIYFHENESDKAIETLKLALEISPDNIPAANAISRIYAALGEQEVAEAYLEQVQRTFDKVTAEERRKTKIVEKLYELQEAYKAQRFQEVIALATEVLPDADTKNKIALYQYLYNSHIALGHQKEAQEALEQANQIQQK